MNGYMDNVAELTKPPFDKPVRFIHLFDAAQQNELIQAIRKVKDNAEHVTA